MNLIPETYCEFSDWDGRIRTCMVSTGGDGCCHRTVRNIFKCANYRDDRTYEIEALKSENEALKKFKKLFLHIQRVAQEGRLSTSEEGFVVHEHPINKKKTK